MNIEQKEILVILAEECSEVIQDSMKMIRFGNTDENLQRLSIEIGQLEYMIHLFKERFNPPKDSIFDAYISKKDKLKVYSNILFEE